jgi:hypothetical protein
MPDQPRGDRDPAAALVLVAVLLAIVATGLMVLQYERPWQYPPGGREASTLAFSSGELKQPKHSRLAPNRSGALLRASPPNR